MGEVKQWMREAGDEIRESSFATHEDSDVLFKKDPEEIIAHHAPAEVMSAGRLLDDLWHRHGIELYRSTIAHVEVRRIDNDGNCLRLNADGSWRRDFTGGVLMFNTPSEALAAAAKWAEERGGGA